MAKQVKKTRGKRNSYKKGRITRRVILQASREVFSRYPYPAASIRMIAGRGGFNHPLIHHYFPSKEALFVEVAQELYQEYAGFSSKWMDGVWDMGMRESLQISIERVVNDCMEHPDALRCVMQNVAHGVRLQEIEGFEYLPEFWTKTLEIFRAGLSPHAPPEHVTMWLLGFQIVVFNFVGAPHFHAQILGLEPSDPRYAQWIKDSLMFLMYPSLKRLVFAKPGGSRPEARPLEAPRYAPGAPMPPPLPSPDMEGLKKGERTRLRILDAAREVFAVQPFNTASIRMIGKQGGFDFTLIHHYFPSKTLLFEALVNQTYEHLIDQSLCWLEGISSLSLEDGLSLFADRALNDCFDKPQGFYALMQNIAQVEHLEDIPGFKRFPEFHETIQDALRRSTGIQAPPRQLGAVVLAIYMLIYNCVGAAALPALFAGRDPNSPGYRQWVKGCFIFLFRPVFLEMIKSSSQASHPAA